MYIYLEDLIFSMESFTESTYLDKFTGKFISSNDLKPEDEEIFIRIPKFDTEKVVRDYITQLDNRQYKKYLQNQCHSNQFGQIFHRFINDKGLYDDYILFYSNATKNVAKEWCTDNNIKFTLKSKPRQ